MLLLTWALFHSTKSGRTLQLEPAESAPLCSLTQGLILLDEGIYPGRLVLVLG